jgi:hypothetical protein
MFADSNSLGLAGSVEKGKFGIYITQNFGRGTSCPTETYNNKVLSKGTDFHVCALEVWAIID